VLGPARTPCSLSVLSDVIRLLTCLATCDMQQSFYIELLSIWLALVKCLEAKLAGGAGIINYLCGVPIEVE
jgi:hypothetical protein